MDENGVRPAEPARLWIILATVAINVAAVTLLTTVRWSDWRTGLALNLLDNWLLIRFAVARRDAFLGRLLLFGVVVGFAELPADAWLVDYTRTLDYSLGGGPMIWRSPMWMPFAWEIVAVQFGYLGLRLCDRFGAAGYLLIGSLGAINIPFYEEMAKQINWWQYRGCRMISNTPYYIILGELGIAIALAILARRVRDGRILSAVLAGLAGGVAIFVCYTLAYLITDGWTRASA